MHPITLIRVLLVDDNPDDRSLVRRTLTQALPNVEIIENANEEQLDQSLQRTDLDLVITDYQLRWTTGLDVLRRFKARTPDLPVIMFTGTGSEEIAVEAMREGLDDYVLKTPKHLVRLRGAVQQALDRREQARAHSELERRYQMLFNNAPVGLYRTKPDGELVDVNPTLARMLGYDYPADLLALRLPDLFADIDEYSRWHIRLEQTQLGDVFETQLRSADGQVVDAAMNVQKIVTSSGAVFYEGSVEDITGRKQLERERASLLELEREARQRAEAADAAKSNFMTMISHQLRTPLTPIIGFSSSLLADDVQFDAAAQRTFIEVIHDEATRMTALVDQLLDAASLYAGTLRVLLQRTTLTDIIARAQPQLRDLAVNHALRIDLAPDLPPITADPVRIGQVLAQLVRNAARHAPPGTPITITARQTSAGEIQVDVADQGPGIPPDARNSVFEAFQPATAAERTVMNGPGVGLALSRGIIEAHNGRIWIADNVPAGTIIAFTLPVVPPPDA